MEGKNEAAGKELHYNNGEEIQLIHCEGATINEEERNKISLVRALVEKQDPSSKVIDLIFNVIVVD